MLEVFDVCSANWRRAIDSELSTLAGDEHDCKEVEVKRRKEMNKRIRDKILLLIKDRRRTSTPGSSSQSTTDNRT